MNFSTHRFAWKLFLFVFALVAVKSDLLADGSHVWKPDYDRSRPAEVSDYASPPTPALLKNADTATGINIRLIVERPRASPGDEITIVAETDEDCYLTVLYPSHSGKILVLWPNEGSNWNHTVPAHRPIRIPGERSGLRLVVDGKHPIERILAYTTAKTHAIFPEQAFQVLPGQQVRHFVADGDDSMTSASGSNNFLAT